MAPIRCGECGQQVSDQAVSCPKCGAPGTRPSVAATPVVEPSGEPSPVFPRVAWESTPPAATTNRDAPKAENKGSGLPKKSIAAVALVALFAIAKFVVGPSLPGRNVQAERLALAAKISATLAAGAYRFDSKGTPAEVLKAADDYLLLCLAVQALEKTRTFSPSCQQSSRDIIAMPGGRNRRPWASTDLPDSKEEVSPLPFEWTLDATADLKQKFAQALEGYPQELRVEMVDCAIAKAVAASPYGPAELFNGESSAVSHRIAGFAKACSAVQEGQLKVAPSWSVVREQYFRIACAKGLNTPWAASWCACVAKEAMAQFDSPRSFIRVYQASDQRELSDQEKLKGAAVSRKCGPASPTGVRPPSDSE